MNDMRKKQLHYFSTVYISVSQPVVCGPLPVRVFFTSVSDKLFLLQSHNCFQINQLIISQT
jgi:hypothetical protein